MSFIPFPALDFHNLNYLCLSLPIHMIGKEIKIIVGMKKRLFHILLMEFEHIDRWIDIDRCIFKSISSSSLVRWIICFMIHFTFYSHFI